MKKAHNFQIEKVQPQGVAYQFYPGVAYKSVAYKKSMWSKVLRKYHILWTNTSPQIWQELSNWKDISCSEKEISKTFQKDILKTILPKKFKNILIIKKYLLFVNLKKLKS